MGDVLSRLRHATGAAHDRLERRLDILNQLSAASSRRSLVERFWGLHCGAERVLAPFLSGVSGLDYGGRSRLPALASDLAALGSTTPGTLPVCPVARPQSVGGALGLLYVLEGSTLGGRVIRREMRARGHPMTGLTFLDPYGSQAGERWRSFLAVLGREAERGGAGSLDEVVLGGVRGFGHVESWLCGAEIADAA